MKVLVTGGGGFLGGAICALLRARGDMVHSYSRCSYAQLATLGVTQFSGDISDLRSLKRAAVDCDAIIHTAAKAGVWGSWNDYHQANVLGTRNVIEVARQLAIPKLVHTSSPSVVFGGSDMENASENAPYPRHYLAHYPKSKAMAEQEVLAANGASLATVSLRPHLIWGPGDHHLVPRILKRAHRLRRIGTRDVIIDSTYIDNAAEAHLLALDRLAFGSALAGKAYFISNDEPWKLWDLVNAILKAGGKAPVIRTIPTGLAYAIGGALEAVYSILRLAGEPPMTRFLAKELSTSHWFDLANAKKDLGYAPKVSISKGLSRLEADLQRR